MSLIPPLTRQAAIVSSTHQKSKKPIMNVLPEKVMDAGKASKMSGTKKAQSVKVESALKGNFSSLLNPKEGYRAPPSTPRAKAPNSAISEESGLEEADSGDSADEGEDSVSEEFGLENALPSPREIKIVIVEKEIEEVIH